MDVNACFDYVIQLHTQLSSWLYMPWMIMASYTCQCHPVTAAAHINGERGGPETPSERDTRREVDRPGAREANCGRLLFHIPVSSSSPFIHLMEAAGLLPIAVQVSSVSFPSLTTSSRVSMIGLPGGTGTWRGQESDRHQGVRFTHTNRFGSILTG